MTKLRRIFFALCMSLAVVFGQQAVALHDLAHATGHKQESNTSKSGCDKCFACAELSAAVGASIPPVALPDLSPVLAHDAGSASACSATILAYRSQAPPVRS